MPDKPESFIPTRASLLGRLKDWEDHESWREFFVMYKRLILSIALKAGLTGPEAEDVLQETLISVAKTIKEFKYDQERCSFKTWLRHLTQKRIADCYRRRRRPGVASPGVDTGSDTPAIERVPDETIPDVEALWDEEWQQKLLEAAMEKIKNQVNAEQYQMFDFYAVKLMPVKKVAELLGTNVAQVYLAKHRVSRLLKKEIKQLEAKMARLRTDVND